MHGPARRAGLRYPGKGLGEFGFLALGPAALISEPKEGLGFRALGTLEAFKLIRLRAWGF